MRLSCRDNCFPVLSHDAALAVIADLDIDGVDVSISNRHDQLVPKHVLADPAAVAARVARTTSRLGLEVADVFVLTGYGPDTLSVNARTEDERAAARRQFDAFVAFAVELGAPGITVCPGETWDDDPKAGLDVAGAELAWRADRAAAVGLALSFEPHAQSNVRTPEAVLDLLARAPGVTITLDYSHFVARGVAEADVDCLIPHARHVQARQAAPGHLQATAKTGTIDFARIVGALGRSGYAGWFGLEYTWNDWIDEVDTLAQTALLRDLVRAATGADT
jgi:sugar phosphate isomerase/epimerase